MNCTELLTGDHVVLRRGLDILDGMMKKLEDGERIEIADVKAVFKFLQVMVLVHGDERALMAWIVDAFEARRVADFVFSSRRLSLILRNHIDKEDAVLCQLADNKHPETFLDLSRLERKYAHAAGALGQIASKGVGSTT